jgi:FkbM family methyltransferase
MYSVFKTAIKRTPLASYIIAARRANKLRPWTPQDAAMSDFYKQFLRSGDLVFDVGANIGNRVKIFLRLGCNVVAVEPQASCRSVLQRAFGRQIAIVPKALSDKIGSASMHISDVDVISSMSPEWMTRVIQSGRFPAQSWTRTATVQTTTLDALCKEFGQPAFIKIDVEGYEASVIGGLSHPVSALSFEFIAEHIQAAGVCVELLNSLAPYSFNFSMAESMKMRLTKSVNASDILKCLRNVDALTWGDVYATLG